MQVSIARTTVEQSLRSTGASSYLTYATPVINAMSEVGSAEDVRGTVEAVLRNQGHRSFIGSAIVNRVIADLESQFDAPTPADENAGFNKAEACDVIEAFLRETFDEEEIDALLVLAGLKEETVVVPEPEATFPDEGGDMASVLRSIQETLTGLAAFARSHGFRG